MKTKNEILDNKFKERGIRKGWIDESRQAVLDAMDEYADEKLRCVPSILDACCGSRMFWFDKQNPNVLYIDKRREKFTIHGKHINVDPDIIADFREMPFADNSFYLVVFDPPHLKWAGKKSFMKAQYGQLDKDKWKEDLAKGFSECMRVLKPNGTLVFKWSDAQINVRSVLELIPYKPLFGNQRGTTHWMVFMKFS